MAIMAVFGLGSRHMARFIEILKRGHIAVVLFLTSVCLAGCVTAPVTQISEIEATAGAFSVPYRISSSGRFLMDVSINAGPTRPLSFDTGATVSVIYGDYARALDLEVSDRTLFVRGLVGQGDRPVIEDVAFQIGSQTFPLDQVVTLKTPRIKDEAVGLLGGDILAGYIVMFNRKTMRVTFLPRQNMDAASFAGWDRIPVRTLADTPTHARLYFAKADLGDQEISVLIDTGANLNFINWKLATMDKDIKKLERDLIRNGTLQGALGSTSATLDTVLYDLKLGDRHWDEIPVLVTALNGLATIAPVDEPMIVAGANLFTPHTLAFDLEGQNLYVYPQD